MYYTCAIQLPSHVIASLGHMYISSSIHHCRHLTLAEYTVIAQFSLSQIKMSGLKVLGVLMVLVAAANAKPGELHVQLYSTCTWGPSN